MPTEIVRRDRVQRPRRRPPTARFTAAWPLSSAPSDQSQDDRLRRAVLDVLDEGVVVIDLDGRLVHTNRAATRILARDLAASVGDRDWHQVLAARHEPEGGSLTVGATVIATGREVRDVEVAVDRPDGSTILLSVNYLPVRGAGGAVCGLVVSFSDVTARTAERRMLLASQERLREAHAVAQLSTWEWQAGAETVDVFTALPVQGSQAHTRIALEELISGLPAEDRARVRTDLEAIAEGERQVMLLRSNPDGDREPTWFEIRARAIREPDGTLIGVHGTAQNVTEREQGKQQAAVERDVLQATLDALPSHIVVLDGHGTIVETNDAWQYYPTADGAAPPMVGADYLAACAGLVGESVARQARAGLSAIRSGARSAFALEYRQDEEEGEERWLLLRAQRFAGPEDPRVVVAHDDVTTRHRAESEVISQAALLDEVDVAVLATDAEGLITHWNRGAGDLYGWSRDEALGRLPGDLIVPADVERAAAVMDELRATGRWEGEFTVRGKDGVAFPAYVRDRVIVGRDGRPAGIIGVSVDVSERVASERALLAARKYLSAVTDSMGEGLYTLDVEGRLMYMNGVAERMLGWSSAELEGRFMDAIVHPPHARRAFESATGRAVRDDVTVRVDDDTFICRDGHALPVSFTASPFETDDGVHGCVVVFEDISERKAREDVLRGEADKLAWIGRIRRTLEDGRFELHAQPIVDLATGATIQRELLLRMRDLDGTLIGPGAFLGVAEEYGQIGAIDRWVIEQGVALAALGEPVEINLSACSLVDHSVLDHIERCIATTGADPASLVFEITETAIIKDEAAARRFAQRLRALGCRLALDDFGTGYGGFTYVKQLPLDFLKIDIEFVRDLTVNPASRHVVTAVVALAAGFELQTVAEGVEDAETYALLRELGVDFAQGYHIARPGPIGAPPTDQPALARPEA